MGQYTIVIEGEGLHHNTDEPKDADRMLNKFLDDLKVAGHGIEHVSFTSISREIIV